MPLLLLALGVLATSGLAAVAAGRRAEWATRAGVSGAVLGSTLALVPVISVLASGSPIAFELPWSVPGGSFRIAIDPLSAWFLVPLLGLAAVTAIYGGVYLAAHRGERSLGPPWLFFNALVATMVLVVVARNAVLFLIAWECMAVASFFLVTFDHDREAVRKAGWIYLVASHLGTAFLLALFAVLGHAAGSLDFERMERIADLSPTLATVAFLLAVVGFGTKAGWVPFHVWLPEAHPAAPSHVSALLSGVMVKLGIYGVLRTLGLLAGSESAWWGWLLIGIGAVSGLYGILCALGQTDLKRMLAYSTVENTGLIAMGLGLSVVGGVTGHPWMARLAHAGALLHVLNHALLKGLLFLAAGAVLHATGTTDMERLGGVAKRMPWTAAAFLTASAAIAALPPLNGFVGELLILLGAYAGLAAHESWLAGLAVIAALGLIAGLVALAFTRAFGVVFLGEPRDASARCGADPPPAMRVVLVVLAGAIVVLGMALPWALSSPVLQSVLDLPVGQPDVAAVFARLGLAFAGFAVLLFAAALARRGLLAGRSVESGPTWGCGFLRPTPRMQYTASSFAEPVLSLFAPLVRMRRQIAAPQGPFPLSAALAERAVDPFLSVIYAVIFAALGRGLGWFRWLQQGRVQLYVLYIAVTLVALLVWATRVAP